MTATAAELIAAYPASAPVASRLVALGARLGVDPAAIANLINAESRWNPAAVNKSSRATGLIQFMPKTAIGLGTSVEVLRTMTVAEQWPVVEQYLGRFAGKLRTGTMGAVDLYLAVFYPKFIGSDLSRPFPPNVVAANPKILTVMDSARHVERAAKLPVVTASTAAAVIAPADASMTAGDAKRRQKKAQRRRKQQRKRKRIRIAVLAGTAALALLGVVAVVSGSRTRTQANLAKVPTVG